MPEFIDYSSRRGAIVPLLPKIHALLKENAEKDKLSGLEIPENLVTWRQKINRQDNHMVILTVKGFKQLRKKRGNGFKHYAFALP